MLISKDMIADTIHKNYSNEGCIAVVHLFLSSSYRSSFIWKQFASQCRQGYDDRSIKKHIPKIRKMLHRHQTSIINTLQRKCDKPSREVDIAFIHDPVDIHADNLPNDDYYHLFTTNGDSHLSTSNDDHLLLSNVLLSSSADNQGSHITETVPVDSETIFDSSLSFDKIITDKDTHLLGCIFLPAEFFQKHLTPNTSTLKKGWTHDFNRHFEKLNDKCVLSFRRHRIQCGKKIENCAIPGRGAVQDTRLL